MKAKTDDSDHRGILFREKVEHIVQDRIRPLLRMHQGDLAVKDTCDGQVWIAFYGTCKTCPAAQITLEETVEQLLRDELGDELTGVHLVNETDEELLEFARTLLDKKNKA